MPVTEVGELAVAQTPPFDEEKHTVFERAKSEDGSSPAGSRFASINGDDRHHRSKTFRYWRVFRQYIWDDPDKPKEEKLFLFKLDFFLLTYTCLG